MQGAKEALPEWTPFDRIEISPDDQATAEIGALERMVSEGHDKANLVKVMEQLRKSTSFLNSRYLVHIYKLRPPGDADMPEVARQDVPDMVHLHVKRRDYKPMGPEHFRDLQRIKNELVGPNCEAVEIYPAERRLVDTGNSYHLWVIEDDTYEFPFGFNGRMVQESQLRDVGTALEQEPFEVEPANPEAPRRRPVIDQLQPHRPGPKRAADDAEIMPKFLSPPIQIADIIEGMGETHDEGKT